MSTLFIRRWLVLLFLVVCMLFITRYILKEGQRDLYKEDSRQVKFEWLDIENLTDSRECRNSKQGPQLIVDDRGLVCQLSEVLSSGCCYGDDIKRYHCESCLSNNCCQAYEHCVSCCLKPDKQNLLASILSHARDTFHVLLRSVKDQFELCLAKCRTSSDSVQHENSYKDYNFKYCYGLTGPRYKVP